MRSQAQKSLLLKLAYTALLVILTITWSARARAQSLAAGQKLFYQNNFSGAETALTKALPSAKSAAEKTKIYKLLGISQYMLKKRPQAQASFKNALKLNPQTTIGGDEVLDESVIPFFNSVKAAKPAKGDVRSAAAIAGSSTAVAPSKKTIVTVNSNVPGTNVSIDGINYGHAGSPIEVSPGTMVLELSATGYVKKLVRVSAKKNTTNTISVELEKIAPKPTPTPKPVVAAREPKPKAQGNAAIVAAAAGAKNSAKGRPHKKANDLFAGEPVDDSFENPAAQPMVPAGGSNSSALALTPNGGGTAPAAPPNPGYAAAPYQMPPYQPAYPPPQYAPPYAAPYGPPPPVYAPQVPYAQPYGPAYAPPSYGYDPYYGQPAAPPPPPDTYAAPPSAAPAPGAPGGPPPPPPELQPPAGKSSQKNYLIALLPFGAGQLQNKSYFKAAFFLVAEGTALTFFYINYQASQTGAAETQKAIQARVNNRDPNARREDLDVYDTQTEDLKKKGQDYVNTTYQNSMYSLYAFGAAWGIGVIDAIIDDPPSSNKKKRKRRVGGLTLLSQPYSGMQLGFEQPLYVPSDTLVLSADLGLRPLVESDKMKAQSIRLMVDWEF